MMNPTILLFIIKLIFGALVAFLAILIMSKTRDAAWMSIVLGFILLYISIIYELMVLLGVFPKFNLQLFDLPLTDLLSIILPDLFFIIGFILKLIKK